MEYKTPPNIILHESKEVIFYISNDDHKKPINIDLWIKELNIFGYKGLLIHSKCIFNRLKKDASLGKKY